MRDRSILKSLVITLSAFLVMLVLFFSGLSLIRAHYHQTTTASLRAFVLRATLTCYAIEGRYPTNIEYLQENYGLTYNAKDFYIALTSAGDNMLPEITVIHIGEG